MFNLAKFSLYQTAKQKEYLELLTSKLEVSNPGWIENLKADADLFNEDGSAKELKKEEVDEKVKSILANVIQTPEITKEEIYSYFIVDKDLLDKFIME